VGLTVSDIERSIRFYRDLLGMTVVRRREIDEGYVAQQTGYSGVQLSAASLTAADGSSQSLEIVQYRNHVGDPSDTSTNRPGNTHLCFRTADISAGYEALSQKGVRFRSAPVLITSGPNEGGKAVYLYDPDDYVIELFEPAVK
jgi:catechol 2,3-dioxygenase-like lactoylglutathione lyase family enzyme